MKILGFIFLSMGWAILIAALILFPANAFGNTFLIAAVCIQIAGVGFLFSAMKARTGFNR